MNKLLKRAVSLFLAGAMLLSVSISAFAAWPSSGVNKDDNYLIIPAKLLDGNKKDFTRINDYIHGFIQIYAVEDGVKTFTPQGYTYVGVRETKPSIPVEKNTIDLKMGVPYDFSKPVMYHVSENKPEKKRGVNRTFPVFAIAGDYLNGWEEWDIQDTKDLLAISDTIADTFHKMVVLSDRLKKETPRVGGPHPGNGDFLTTLGWWLGMQTAYYEYDNSDIGGNRLFDSHEQVWREGGQQARDFTREYILGAIRAEDPAGKYRVHPAIMKTIYDEIIPFYLDYAENTLIEEPVLQSVVLNDSVGQIDRENHTVTIRLPKGTDLTQLPDPQLTVSDWCKVNKVAGAVCDKKLAYQVTPCDLGGGAVYDDLSQTWEIKIEEGTPINAVTSFSVVTDGKERYAKIDETQKTIRLNLPEGTDLTAIKPKIVHTGTKTSMDEKTVDFTNSDQTPITLTVTNDTFNLTTEYKVSITASKSNENYITSYSIENTDGIISEDKISVKVPYAVDLDKVTPQIEISEFANITKQPTQLQIGDNIYEVTAENGDKRTYTVTITKEKAATENRILSFTYGSVEGKINDVQGTISLELPSGISKTFAPTIEVSEFATVSPASGEQQDFSNPVKYTVTAQNGSTNTYTVTVTQAAAPAENPYKEKMEALVAKIINRYRTQAADNWEYMDIGFYDKKLDNMSANKIAERIKDLDSTTNVAMTNIDRQIMTLTANGIDCTNLAKYNNGNSFVDAKGNEIDNLVEVLYNYQGGWTINGPAFALIALDMGNYTVPENAFWTREKLLETLLNHKYLSDGFGLDMVSMIMQSFAPYYNDPVYGERVRAKLNEGFKIIQDGFGDKNDFKNPFGVQWGGVYTSEGSAQVLCALCSMGIDAHSDPRLNKGEHSALTALLDYANYEDGYFHHTLSAKNNAMATYQGCYATQWYLDFLANGGAGHPYSLYANRFDFSKDLSADVRITKFVLDGKEGNIIENTENEEAKIEVKLPTGTKLDNMYPEITMSEGAKLIAPNIPVTFTEGAAQPFTVLAEDGKTQKTYYVTVTLSDDVQSSGAEIIAPDNFKETFSLMDANISRELEILGVKITEENDVTKIELLVNPGVNTKALKLKANISQNATCVPALDGEKAMDLSDWTTFTITSQDGKNQKTYQIKVTPKEQAEITAFTLTIDGTLYEGQIDNQKNTITVSGVDDSKLTTTKFAPDITFTGKVCNPSSGIEQDFSSAIEYTVTGDNMAPRTYTAIVLNKEGKPIKAGSSDSSGTDKPNKNPEAKIKEFVVCGVKGEINEENSTIVVVLPLGTNITAVAPEIKTDTGCIVTPASGEVVNLSSPIVYTVTLGTESRQYTVEVVLERSVSQQLWDELANGNNTVTDHQVSRDPHGLAGGWGSGHHQTSRPFDSDNRPAYGSEDGWRHYRPDGTLYKNSNSVGSDRK